MKYLTLALELLKRLFSALDARTGIEEVKRIQAEEALAAEREARAREREVSSEINANPDRAAVADSLRKHGF